MSRSTDISYRHHSIKSLRNASGWRAQAWRGKGREAKAVGDIHIAATLDAAVLAVKDFLDERATTLLAQRGPGGFPCAAEIRAALPQVPMNKAREAMLVEHLNATDHILTATELAQAAGYGDYSVANLQYGQLAYDLAQELDWTPEEQTNGVTTWTFTLADDADKQVRKAGGEVPAQWRWQLRSEVIEALS